MKPARKIALDRFRRKRLPPDPADLKYALFLTVFWLFGAWLISPWPPTWLTRHWTWVPHFPFVAGLLLITVPTCSLFLAIRNVYYGLTPEQRAVEEEIDKLRERIRRYALQHKRDYGFFLSKLDTQLQPWILDQPGILERWHKELAEWDELNIDAELFAAASRHAFDLRDWDEFKQILNRKKKLYEWLRLLSTTEREEIRIAREEAIAARAAQKPEAIEEARQIREEQRLAAVDRETLRQEDGLKKLPGVKLKDDKDIETP